MDTENKIPLNVEIERIVDEEGFEVIGYYAQGHWKTSSVAIATNLEWDEALSHSDFKHGYMQKEPSENDEWLYELTICEKDEPGAFAVTYTWD